MRGACCKFSANGRARASRRRMGDVDGAIQECALQGNLFPKEVAGAALDLRADFDAQERARCAPERRRRTFISAS